VFLNWAAVRRHISASRPCHAAQLGFREIIVEALLATSWPERAAQRGLPQTSNTRQQVTCHMIFLNS
jgi:hypothetical protein